MAKVQVGRQWHREIPRDRHTTRSSVNSNHVTSFTGQGRSCLLETHMTVALIAILAILLAYSCGVTVLWCYSRRKGGDSKCCSGKEQKKEQDTE